jgi:hypothetical protein
MSEPTKHFILQFTLFIIFVALMVWAILIPYGDVKTVDGEPVLTNWSYLRMSIQIAILNFFIATSMARLKIIQAVQKRDESIKTNTLTFIFFISSGLIPLLYYPGLSQLQLAGDPNFATVAGNLVVLQTMYFYLVVKITLKEEVKLVTYGLLLLLAIAVIFISVYLPGTGSQSFYIDQ